MYKQVDRERSRLLRSIDRLLEGPMIFLGFLWLLLLVVELVWGLTKMLEYLSLSIWIIFILDFLIKLVLAPNKILFLKRNWLTTISLVIPALRVFRIFRFFRVVRGLRGIRLVRVLSSLNRSMKGLTATMQRRGFAYVMLLTTVIIFAGAAGMLGFEKSNPGFENYSMALWWTAMRVITAGSDFWPITPEGRAFAFILSLYGYGVFGYVTATLATFFIGRDAEEENTPVAGSAEIQELRKEISSLKDLISETRLSWDRPEPKK